MSSEESLLSIEVVHNGPLKVNGKFELIDKDGSKSIQEGSKFLCRCGHSHHKPFCDGTHTKTHFDDTADS